MNLKTYLKKHKLRPTEFARDLGVGYVSLYRYINGLRSPDHEVMQRLEKLTGGEVTYYDFFPKTK